MTTLIIALLAALAAVALIGLLVAGRSLRGRTDARLADALAEMNERVDAMSRELADVLNRTEAESRRSRVLGELAGSIDIDEVLNRTLEAAGAVPGVDAGVVSVSAPDGTQLVASIGVPTEEAERHALPGPPDGSIPRAISVGYAYKAETAIDRLRAGLAVPLASEGEHLGYLTVYSRTDEPFGEDDLSDLEELALRAGPAIENARRFREARQLADLDALTSLHNRRYFHETLAREVARAHRYSRHLALIVFDLDDFKAINDRIGHLAGDAVLAEAAERVRDVVRSADVACRVGGDEFAVILPESAVADAEALYRRLQSAVSSRPVGQAGRLQLSAGVAELQAEDDAVNFFQRADEALYRAKDAGKGTVVAAGATVPPAPAPGPWPRQAPESASS